MKKLVFTFTLALLAISTIFAQQRGRQQANDRNEGSKIERMASELDLSDEQVNHLKAFSEQQRASMREQGAELESREEKQELVQAFRAAWETEVEATLTPEQFVQFSAAQEERQVRQQERLARQQERAERQPRRRLGNLSNMAEELALSEEQQTSLREFSQQQRAQMTEDLAATEDQAEQQAIRQRYAEAFEQELRNSLNEEQLETLETLRTQRQADRQSRTRRHRGEQLEGGQ